MVQRAVEKPVVPDPFGAAEDLDEPAVDGLDFVEARYSRLLVG